MDLFVKVRSLEQACAWTQTILGTDAREHSTAKGKAESGGGGHVGRATGVQERGLGWILPHGPQRERTTPTP